jgi:hypothetical protein
VGFLSALRATQTQVDIQASLAEVTKDPSAMPIASPWSDNSHLADVLWNDIFGGVPAPIGRKAAMRIPAVARGRNLLVSTICRMPLRAYQRDQLLPVQPAWTSATDNESPIHRIAWTVDDLIFYGVSCWWRDNDATGKFPLRYRRIPFEDWQFDGDGHVLVNGTVARANEVTVIPGLHEGILSFGDETLRDARALYRVVSQRLKNPVPTLELHQTGGEQLDKDEIAALVKSWTDARNSEDGTVGYTNETIELKEHGSGDAQLLVEARNAAALDLARLVGVHGGMVDATTPKASLNYETTTGRNQEFIDIDAALYMTPITARLSMDDVVARGQRVAFDLADSQAPTPSPSGPATED